MARSLRGLAVVDASTLWVGGDGGTLRRSVDGGATWHDVAPAGAAAFDFRDIEAFDRDTALAVVAGVPARVFRTTDGGRTWRVVFEDERPGAFLDAVAFAGDAGVLVGDPVGGSFCVFWSADRGATWRPVPSGDLPAPHAGEACFAASGTCAAFSAPDAPCFVTGGAVTRFVGVRPGDAPWETRLPLRAGGDAAGAFSIAFAGRGSGSGRGVVVGGDYRQPHEGAGTAAWTEDGGRTWQAAASGPDGYRSAVAWLDDATALAVGSHGASLSSDGGRTWQPFPGSGLHAVAVGSDGSVFACGQSGRVVRFAAAGR